MELNVLDEQLKCKPYDFEVSDYQTERVDLQESEESIRTKYSICKNKFK